jgi:hypothetical protein
VTNTPVSTIFINEALWRQLCIYGVLARYFKNKQASDFKLNMHSGLELFEKIQAEHANIAPSTPEIEEITQKPEPPSDISIE